MLSQGLTSLLEEESPFVGKDFIQDRQKRIDHFLKAKILVVGAGGLGCEVIKSLVLNGFKHIDIVDDATVSIIDLNTQFFYRKKDIGRSKAESSAEYAKNLVHNRFGILNDDQQKTKEEIDINYHTKMIQTLEDDYFAKFDLIIGALNNFTARSWLSQKLYLLYQITGKCIPYIDGSTLGWNGNVVVIFPGHTACMSCMQDIFSQSKVKPVCHEVLYYPRQPEHLVLLVVYNMWFKYKNEDFDPSNIDHCALAAEKANQLSQERKLNFNIDTKFVQSVFNPTSAKIASTCGIIGSLLATEAIKIITNVAPFINNNTSVKIDENTTNLFRFSGDNDFGGVNVFTDRIKRKDDCMICNVSKLKFIEDETLEQLINRIKNEFHISEVSVLNTASRLIKVSNNQNKKITELGIHPKSTFMAYDMDESNKINILLY